MTSSQPVGLSQTTYDPLFIHKTTDDSPNKTDDVSTNAPSRDAQTAYQPSTGTDPSGGMDYELRKKEVKREMSGRWVEHDNNLLDCFFPRGTASQDDIEHVKGELYDKKKKRWKKIPREAKSEKVLVAAILGILNAIYEQGRIGPDHHIIDTQDQPIPTHDGRTLKTDLYISLLHMLVSSAEVHETKPTSFKQCLSFIEGKLHNSRRHSADLVQLAMYSRELFMAQSNRRFVPFFSMTEKILQFSTVDRSGGLRSSHFDYHKDPDRFCEIFFSLLRYDAASLGFDDTVFFNSSSVQCITTTERTGADEHNDVTYIVEALLMRSYTIFGSGTTYWRARREDGSKSSERYIIKDSWRTSDMEDEQALIRDAENNVYVASLVHTEVVRSHRGGNDTTVRNRLTPLAARETCDRIHTRAVYKSSGRLLENFQDPIEVLIALHHAIKGHGLLRARGILYQDILPWNILIPPGNPGDSGALIDLDRAVRTWSPHNTSRDFTPGSWFFLPRSTLAGETVTTHIDDLETFFHIFCFIVVGHTGPSLARSRIKHSGALAGYGSESEIALNAKKYLVESETFNFTVQTEYFKEPTAKLAKDLHSFFHTKWRRTRDMKEAGQPLPPPDIVGDYNKVTGHIFDAIKQLAILRGYILPLDPASELSEVDDIVTFLGARVEEIEPSQVQTVGHKRSLSMAEGQERRNLPRKCKRARVAYSDYVF